MSAEPKAGALPCPFCGSDNVRVEPVAWDVQLAVICGDCDASGPAINAFRDEAKTGRAKNEAIAAWNTRK